MSQQFYQVGGSLPADAQSYIKREADDKLYNYLKEGKYCYVLNARQVGKSSLRVQTSKRLEEEGYNCINIDLTSIGSEDITADEWYFSFIYQIIEQLSLEENLFIEWWEENDKLTVVNRFAKTLDKFILAKTTQKIVIFIDEVDAILGIKKDFSANDFFAVIRTFYNLRSEDERYNRVSFSIFGVATPEDLMRDSSRTPFNIAHGVTIKQFKLEESLSLLDGLANQKIDSRKILKRIFEWTSGTPYLTQKILDYIVNNPIDKLEDIDNIVDVLFIQESFKEINISNIHNRIISSKKYNVKMLYLISKLIIEGRIKADDGKLEQIYLKLSGLVKEIDGLLVYTNKIYKKIFNQAWFDENIGKIDRPLSKDLQRWIELDRPNSALLKGKVLEKAKDWAVERDDLTSGESEYLRLSSQLEQETVLSEEKKKEESRRVRSLTIFSLVLIVVSIGIIYIYFEARKQEKIAKNNESIAKEQLKKIQVLRYNDYCNKGNTYFNQKMYKKSIQSYNKALDIDDKKQTAYMALAKIYQKKEEYNKAINIYIKIAKIDNNNDKNWNNLGYTYLLLNDYNNSLNSLKRALDINPKYYYASNTMGLVYLKMEKYQKAMSTFKKTIEIKANYSKPYINIGDIYFNNKKYNDAISFYKKALKVKKSYSTYYKIGLSYLKQEKYEDAIKAYNKALEFFSSKKEQAYKDKGFAYFKLEQYVKAKESFSKAIEFNSNIEIDYYMMGIIYDKLQESEKATEMYLKAIVKKPKTKEEFSQNGDIYLKAKDYKKALSSYFKVIEIDSGNYKALIKLGIIYNELGKFESNYGRSRTFFKNALIQFNKALKINPTDSAYYNMGNTYYRMKQRTKAIEQYKQAIELNPSNDKAYNDLALTYLESGKSQIAIDTYKQTTKINAKHYKAYNSMGVAYLQLAGKKNKNKNNVKAVECYRKSIAINPEYNNAYMNLFKFQLFNRESFDWKLEYDYINTFKNQKEIFMQYEMLKILQKIANEESYEALISKWQKEYKDTKLKWNSFRILYKWARKHSHIKKKKLLKALDFFKNHNKKIK